MGKLGLEEYENDQFTIYKYFGNKPIIYQLDELEFIKFNRSSIVFNFKNSSAIWFYSHNPIEDRKFIKKMNLPVKGGLRAKSRFRDLTGS